MRSSTEEVATYDDAGDRVSVKEKEKRAKVREEQRLNGLKQIMETPNGRVWMWKFLSDAGMFSTAFNGNSRDYYNLGQRNAAMPHFAEIQKYCMNEYMMMVKENVNV